MTDPGARHHEATIARLGRGGVDTVHWGEERVSDEMDFTPGRWMVLPGYRDVFGGDVRQIAEATAKLVKYRSAFGSSMRQVAKVDVTATFASKACAERLRDSLGGIGGERDRRISAARDAAKEAADKAIRAARGRAA